MVSRTLPALSLLVSALLVFSAGCTMTGSAPAPAPATPAPAAAVLAKGHSTPTDAEMKELIARFDATAEKERAEWGIPGMSVAIVKDGKVIFAKGYGVKEAGKSDPVTPDTVFQIASVSKSFTSVLVAQQVDRGKMNWTDPLIWYIPDFRLKDPWVTKEYTITDAMAHRSGLPDNWGAGIGLLGYNRSELVHDLRYAEPVSSFRTEFKYQNLPYIAVAAAAENTSRKRWEQGLRDEIFVPLNLTSASTTFADLQAAPDHATPHRLLPVNATSLAAQPVDPAWRFNTLADTIGPAGGMNMNIRDLATWAMFQMGNGTWNGKRIVSEQNLEYLHTPKILYYDQKGGIKLYYCHGWEYEEVPGSPSILMHDGNILGMRSMVLLVPDEQLGVVVLTNAGDYGLGDTLAMQFYNDYFGREDPGLNERDLANAKSFRAYLLSPETRPANPAAPLPLARYTGTYHDDVYGTATVTEKDGNLTLSFGKDPVTFILSPWDGTTFMATLPVWGPDYRGKAVFSTNSDGSIRDLSIPLIMEGMSPIYKRTVTFVRTGSS